MGGVGRVDPDEIAEQNDNLVGGIQDTARRHACVHTS
jgi:hypothetical protein